MVPLPLAVIHKDDIHINLFSLEVYVKENTSKSFDASLPDIKTGLLTLKNGEDCLRLTRKPLSFYQNQFNMAIWFATSACSISFYDQLNHSNPMIKSLFRFHAYYQINKILKQLQIPKPGRPTAAGPVRWR
jgi:hypothetical protein